MKEYYVEWRMQIDAESPEDAARKCLEIQRDPDSTATVFHVADEVDGFIEIDAEELEDGT